MTVLAIVAVIFAIASLLVALYFGHKLKRPKIYGVIVMHDENNMYLELDNSNSMSEIFNSDYVVFKVQKSHK